MNRCAQALAPLGMAALTSLIALHATSALAQPQRNFPAHALRGELTVVQGAEVRLNGQPARLAPGARIRDLQNLLVLSGAIAGVTHPVHYTLEPNGLLLDVWLLRPEEKAREPWPRTVAESRTWLFDVAGQSWTRR